MEKGCCCCRCDVFCADNNLGSRACWAVISIFKSKTCRMRRRCCCQMSSTVESI